jgi:hypothetical protein
VSNGSSTLLDFIDQIQRKAPEYIDLLVADTDSSFEAAFAAILEKAVHSLETNGKNFSPLDEEGLTAVLALALTIPGLTVTQETNSNGHVDLTVVADHCVPMRKKLGEAKIYDGPEKHLKGLAQLLGRYTTGREGRGLLISYVKKSGIAQIVTKLREKMDADKPLLQQGSTSDLPIKWAFLSCHDHSCGEVLEVGHISCNLGAGIATAP